MTEPGRVRPQSSLATSGRAGRRRAPRVGGKAKPRLGSSASAERYNRQRCRRLVALALALAATGGMLAGTLVGLLVFAVPGWGAVLGAAAGLGVAGALASRAVGRVGQALVRASGAVAADAHRHARLENLVTGLCLATGLDRPELFVIDDPCTNVAMVGHRPDRSFLVVTRGLLEQLSRVELEGVVARQLAAVRRGEVAAATVECGLLARPLSPAGMGGPSRLTRFAAPPAMGGASESDLAGAALTRYPPGLAGALEKVARSSRVRDAPAWSSALWLTDPATADPKELESRIQALREL
ncbi:MAG: hypothetical protein ACT4OS_04310 [Acidimicrobiales bacterium]